MGEKERQALIESIADAIQKSRRGPLQDTIEKVAKRGNGTPRAMGWQLSPGITKGLKPSNIDRRDGVFGTPPEPVKKAKPERLIKCRHRDDPETCAACRKAANAPTGSRF